MAQSDYPKFTKIEDLVEIQSFESGDFFLTYSKEGKASLLNFKNLIIGLANTDFSTTVNNLLSRVGALETGLLALTETVSIMNITLSSLIASNTSRITALETTVSANYTTLSSQITTINSTLSNHTSRIAALEATTSRLGTLDVTGMVIAVAGNTIPSDWIICDGREISRVTYSRLFAVIGTLYGGGNATTTFNVPNLNGRVIIQKDNGSNVIPEANNLGVQGGEARHALTGPENGPHNHMIATPFISGDPIDGLGQIILTPNHVMLAWHNDSDDGSNVKSLNVVNSPFPAREPTGVRTSMSGSGTPHNIVQPYLAMQFIIRT